MMDLLFVSASDNFTGRGQVTLNASVDQGPAAEQAPEVAINVIEGESVTFRCQAITQTPTLNTRLPGTTTFGTTLPSNLRFIDPLTFQLINVSRSDNGTAFQCRAGGGFTDIGVIIVLRKLLLLHCHVYYDDCYDTLCIEMTALMSCVLR